MLVRWPRGLEIRSGDGLAPGEPRRVGAVAAYLPHPRAGSPVAAGESVAPRRGHGVVGHVTQRASGVAGGGDVATGAPGHDAIPRAAPAAARPPGPHGRGDAAGNLAWRIDWQQSVHSAPGMCVLPPPTSPTGTTSPWRPGRGDGGRRARGGRARRPTPSRSRRAPWPAAGRASRAPARTLGPGALGGVPGLPGRATRAPPVQWRARRGAPAAGGGDARRERSRVRRHGASPPRGRGGHRPPGRPRPRRARRPRRAWRARRRTRRRARARHRRPPSPPRRRPRT